MSAAEPLTGPARAGAGGAGGHLPGAEAPASSQSLPGPTPEPVEPAELWRWVADAVRPLLGWVLTGAGLLSLLVTWYEVSGTAVVAEQLPYLASGGLLGLALVTLGGRAFLIEDLRRDSGRLNRLERQVAELHAVLLSRPDAPDPAAAAGRGRRADLVALPGAKLVHRAGCALVDGKAAEALTAAAARRRGLDPCPVCEPLAGG